jgi:hypothetical protein
MTRWFISRSADVSALLALLFVAIGVNAAPREQTCLWRIAISHS